MCKGQGMMGLGITLIALGTLSAIIGIAAASAFQWDLFSRISAPIWTGFFVILTGSMGFMGGKSYDSCVQNGRSNGYVPAFLTLSIIGIFVTIAQQSINGIGGSWLGWCFHEDVENAINQHSDTAAGVCQSAAAIHWTCIALGFIEMVVCFASSIVGCVVGCSCGAPVQPSVVVMQTPAAMPMTVINSSGMQGGYAYSQTGYIPGGGYIHQSGSCSQQPAGYMQQPPGYTQQPTMGPPGPPSYLPPPAQQQETKVALP